jgi:iron(III) transport system substrate-binding protein
VIRIRTDHRGSPRTGERGVLASLLTVAVLGLAACGSGSGDGGTNAGPTSAGTTSWEDVVSAANDEGRLVVYSTEPPDLNAIYVEKFNEDYPDIEVEMVRLTSQELTQRVEAESSAGRADSDVVLALDQAASAVWAERGWTVPLIGPNVTSDEAQPFLSDNGHTINGGSLPIGFAWNPTSGVEPPATPEDLADPRYEGRFAVYNWVGTSALAALVGFEEVYGEGFLESLAANDPKFYDSTVQIAQDIAAGAINASLVMNPTSMLELPIEMKYGETPPAWLKIGMVRANGENPNAAQVFTDWAMTTRGQEAWGYLAGSSLPNIEGTEFDSTSLHLLDASYYDPAFQEEWRAKLSEIFNRTP